MNPSSSREFSFPYAFDLKCFRYQFCGPLGGIVSDPGNTGKHLTKKVRKVRPSGTRCELLTDTGIVKTERLSDLMKEADELTAILVTSAKTLKRQENPMIHHSSFSTHHSHAPLMCRGGP